MKLVRTAKFILPAEAVVQLLPSIEAFTKAYNFAAQIGWDNKIFDGVKLHKKTYTTLREQFGLPAQLAISARMKALDSLKSVRALHKKRKQKISAPQSKQASIRYDMRSYSLWLDKQEVSLLTLSGRQKFKLHIPECYQQYLTWKHTSAELKIYGNVATLNVVFEKDIADLPSNGRFIGIDRGINNLAVVASNDGTVVQFFNGKAVKKVVQKYRRKRRSLQKANSRSARRHLKKVRGQERRFRADVNHQISKQIVAGLLPGDTIVLENLTGIRNRRMRKKMRANFHNWSFFQFEQFLIYKAAAESIAVVYIPPHWTSQRCSQCGCIDKKNRNRHDFCCTQCGYKLNADLNAALNICNKHLQAIGLANQVVVNQPNVLSSAQCNALGQCNVPTGTTPSLNGCQSSKPTDLSVGN